MVYYMFNIFLVVNNYYLFILLSEYEESYPSEMIDQLYKWDLYKVLDLEDIDIYSIQVTIQPYIVNICDVYFIFKV